MRPVRRVTEKNVWDHWRRVENHTSPYFRADIRNRLPRDLAWFLCELQANDIDRLFIISSDDWSDISAGTFRVADVAARLDYPSANADTMRISGDIHGKLNFISSGGHLDSQLVSITDSPSLSGPFTLMEGNRRGVTFLLRNTLVGSLVYVGYSPKVINCFWARHTYRQFLHALIEVEWEKTRWDQMPHSTGKSIDGEINYDYISRFTQNC